MSTEAKNSKIVYARGKKIIGLSESKYDSKKAFDPIVAHQSCWLVKDVNFSLYA